MDNCVVVKAIYDAGQVADVKSIQALFADDIVLYEASNHPAILTDPEKRETPGVWRGLKDVMSGIGKIFGALNLTGIDVETIVSDGPERVVSVFVLKGIDHTGAPYSMPGVEVFKVSGGKVKEIRALYFDVALLNARLGLA